MVDNKNVQTKIGILKLGNIASSVLLEMLLDERADRDDIDVQTISSGAKLTTKPVTNAAAIFEKLDVQLAIVATPNASLPVPLKTIKKVHKQFKQLIVVTDIMKKETREELGSLGIGYLVVKADAMIGARREFLDPTEMAIFNADLIKVLAVGGVFAYLQQAIDKVIHSIAKNKEQQLPQTIITAEKAVAVAGFGNAYAAVKAKGALEIAQQVASVSSKGCFKIKDRLQYVPQVAAAHEMMRQAAMLADEAREIEKSNDTVRRQPHYYDGKVQDKRTLTEKPTTPYED